MTKRFLKFFTLPLIVVLCPMVSVADQRFIVDYFKNFQTLEANFTQEIITKDREDTTSGQLIIEKSPIAISDVSSENIAGKGAAKRGANPKFVFDYTKPYQQILLSNGQQFWFYDVDLMQVIIKPLKEVVNNPVLQILLSDKPLDENFNIKEVRDRREYLLTPKQTARDLEITDIKVIFANRKIYSFEVEDVTGQKIAFVMKGVVENKAIPAATFDFEIPKDVDVIDETK